MSNRTAGTCRNLKFNGFINNRILYPALSSKCGVTTRVRPHKRPINFIFMSMIYQNKCNPGFKYKHCISQYINYFRPPPLPEIKSRDATVLLVIVGMDRNVTCGQGRVDSQRTRLSIDLFIYGHRQQAGFSQLIKMISASFQVFLNFFASFSSVSRASLQ